MTEALKGRIRAARKKFLAMAGAYCLGVFNDNLFRQGVCLLAVAKEMPERQTTVMMLFTVPYLLFAAPAGWLADRFSKGRVVVAAKGLEVVAMLLGALGIVLGSWPLMLAMAFLMGLQSCLFGPALNGSIPELYPEEYVPKANGILKVVVTLAILGGIVLSGPVLDGFEPFREVSGLAWLPDALPGWLTDGPDTMAILVLGLAVVGLGISLGVPRRAAAAPDRAFPWQGPWDTLKEIWAVRKDPLLHTIFYADAFIWGLGTCLNLMVNVLAIKQLGMDKTTASLMMTAQMAGLAIGGLLGGWYGGHRRWYRYLPLCALVVCGALLAAALVPSFLPPSQAVYVLTGLLAVVGLAGGAFMIPCESFVQIRPAADRKGAVIAASNFLVFVGIILASLLYAFLVDRVVPTTAMGIVGLLSLGVAGWLFVVLPSTSLDGLLRGLLRFVVGLRYRVRVEGLDRIAAAGREGILFLPNHPALVDPVIMGVVLHRDFDVRFLADSEQVDRPFIRWLARRLRILTIDDTAKTGAAGRAGAEAALAACAGALGEGDNLVIYPAGRIYRSAHEDLRSNSGVERVLAAAPDARIVLVRTTGLWGSAFSRAGGGSPDLGRVLVRGALRLLAAGLFFMPRRRVTLTFHEPGDLPRGEGRAAFNAALEGFYNADPRPHTYVPYTPWERGGARTLPEPALRTLAGDPGEVPPATRRQVLERLVDLSGVSAPADDARLAHDLGLDSLSVAEVLAWLEEEFGFPAGNVDSVQTVGDVMLAACGRGAGHHAEGVTAPPKGWSAGSAGGRRLDLPPGENLAAVFLARARRHPGRIAVADQLSGGRTYRDIVTALFVLRPVIAALPGERIGIMLPASVGADVLYLAVLFSGRTPVMVNWTVGPRNLAHALDTAGVERVLTAGALTARLAAQGVDLGPAAERLVTLESLAGGIPWWRKLAAAVRARVSWRALDRAPISPTAVLLFTSGSESLPKAVPLSHANLLANLRDMGGIVEIREHDRLLGFLPPFHSFGLTVGTLLPLCYGMPVVHHPDPNAGAVLAALAGAYGTTMVVGTPTFLRGILRGVEPGELAGLRLVVTGAEKCPDAVYDALAAKVPGAVVLEGYGITECSPVVSVNRMDAPRRGTIGKVLPGLEYAVREPEGDRRVATGERGLLLVRGPSVFEGYLDEAADPFVDFEGKRWYDTGDLVREDGEGVLTFSGRRKRFVKLGGEMISLPAIEAVLLEAFAAEAEEPVLAVDGRGEEGALELVLYTVLDLDRERANGAIRAAGLSGLHTVRLVERLDAIPLLGTGKTDYRALRGEKDTP